MQGQGSAAKIGERYRWGGYPSIFGKTAGAGQCSKKLERAFGKMQGQGSKKLASATAGGYPISLGKCKGRAVQSLLGGYPTIFGKNAGAGQCSKNWRALLGGYPSILQEQGSAVKIWRARPLGGDPCISGKNMGALIPTKTP